MLKVTIIQQKTEIEILSIDLTLQSGNGSIKQVEFPLVLDSQTLKLQADDTKM
jgi:hypothetical protein